MLSRANSVSWMGGEDRDDDNSWSRNLCDIENNNNNNNNLAVDNVNGVSSSSFKTMLEVENEWYNITTNSTTENLLLNPPIIDSSSSCSPSPSVLNQSTTLDTSHIPYLFPPSKPHFFTKPLPPSLNNFGNADFFQEPHQIPGNAGFSHFGTEMGSPNFGGNSHFTNTHLIHLGDNPGFGLGSASGSASKFQDFQEGSPNSSIFLNRTSKLLKPLDNSTPVGAQPTLFQKRAALRKNFGGTSSGNLTIPGSDSGLISNGGDGESERKRKMGSFGILDDVSFTGSDFNYDSDDFTENNNDTGTLKDSDQNGGTNSNANSSMTGNGNGGGDSKGKKKGLPAKNLMAERRRRKKLNDRLYMLRSVVPKISKMDRASILGDAIEYLKELLQKINDLHNELESSPPASTLTQSTNFHPLTPTLPNLSSRIKEELCPSSMPSPNGQPARIEVRLREGRAVNIHMFCSRRPGLLLSTMRALDGLGLDIQQAVISCFNGFAMDIFRAEQCKDGQEVHPEQIKALLLDSATFHGSNIVANRNV